jgi:hypothetical protein
MGENGPSCGPDGQNTSQSMGPSGLLQGWNNPPKPPLFQDKTYGGIQPDYTAYARVCQKAIPVTLLRRLENVQQGKPSPCLCALPPSPGISLPACFCSHVSPFMICPSFSFHPSSSSSPQPLTLPPFPSPQTVILSPPYATPNRDPPPSLLPPASCLLPPQHARSFNLPPPPLQSKTRNF